VEIRELGIPGAFEITPRQHPDGRGVFFELYKAGPFTDAVGHPLAVRQANCSVSAAGTVRGIHFADVPPGQAKYVACLNGAILDVAVDLRVGSPTYGAWEAVRLDTADRRALYLSEGIGHAFMALTDGAAVHYLCSQPYAPAREHAVHPLDPVIGIAWPAGLEPVLSPRDAAAPTLAEAAAAGLLPDWAACQAYTAALREQGAPSAGGPPAT
jgi:dTDP-4-dehydrorhamnose 3,5-epimerase